MITRDTTPPSIETVRSGRSRLPVLPGLEDALVDAAPGDPRIPFVMASLATYAYGDEETVTSMAARLGLPDNRCRLIEEDIDVLFVRTTAYLIQSADGRVVILVYRGTTPTSTISWLGDIDVDPEKVAVAVDGNFTDYEVHGGFYRNVRATGFKVVEGLDRAARGRSIFAADDDPGGAVAHPMQAFYIAGHSLGGAQASLCAVLLRSDREDNAEILAALRTVYTFGAPMVCGPDLAEVCDAPDFLGGKVVRYVFGDDAVPQLPPTASGSFQHFGTELRHARDDEPGRWTPAKRPTGQLRNAARLLELIPSFLARQVTALRWVPFSASLADHLPRNYMAALAADLGIRSEFGD